MTRARDIANVISDADLAGNIDVDGTTNLDNTDIDGTLNVQGETTLQTHLNMGDSDIIKLGASNDLQILHDGSNSLIVDNGTGSLIMRGSTRVFIQGVNEEIFFEGNENGQVKLYNDNNVKLTTTSGGVTVTGTCTATTFSGSGASLTNLPASGPFQDAPVTSGASNTISVGTSYTTIVQVAITHDANDRVIIFANFQLDTQSSSTSGQGDFRILATNTSQSAELNVNDILAESARLRWQQAYIARDSRGISATTTYYIQVRKTNGTMNVNHSQGTSRILLFLEKV